MKTIISIFLIALSLLSEISTMTQAYWCDTEREKMETAESSETCEHEVSTIKVTTQVRKIEKFKSFLCAYIYSTENVLVIENKVAALIHSQHQKRQHASPIYLNNRVFLL